MNWWRRNSANKLIGILGTSPHFADFGKGRLGDVESQQSMSIPIHPPLETELRAKADAEGLTVEAYLEHRILPCR